MILKSLTEGGGRVYMCYMAWPLTSHKRGRRSTISACQNISCPQVYQFEHCSWSFNTMEMFNADL